MRGFDYYTGLRLAGYADGAGQAVLAGGRYDHLVGQYGRDARAVGFAVDIEAVADAEHAAGIAPPAPPPAVLIDAPRGSRPRRRQAQRLAAALRRRGVAAAVDLGPRRSAVALRRYAAEAGFSQILVLASRGSGRAVVPESEPESQPGPDSQPRTRPGSRPTTAPKPVPLSADLLTGAAAGDGACLTQLIRALVGRPRRNRRS